MKRSCLILGLSFLVSAYTLAQSRNKTLRLIGLNGFMTGQVNSFEREYGGIGMEYFGKSIIHKKSSDGFHLQLGGALLITGLGSTTNNVTMHQPKNFPGTQRLSNNLIQLDFRSKFVYNTKYVSPYVDMIVGFADFYSEQMLKLDRDTHGFQRESKTTKFSSGSITYGAALGCMIRLGKRTSLDIKTTYLGSANPVNMVDYNHLSYDGHMYYSQNTQVVPSLIAYQVGLNIAFESNNSYGEKTKTSKAIRRLNRRHARNATWYRDSYPRGSGGSHSGGYYGGGGGGGGAGLSIY